jgi:hypothetical protein
MSRAPSPLQSDTTQSLLTDILPNEDDSDDEKFSNRIPRCVVAKFFFYWNPTPIVWAF